MPKREKTVQTDLFPGWPEIEQAAEPDSNRREAAIEKTANKTEGRKIAETKAAKMAKTKVPAADAPDQAPVKPRRRNARIERFRAEMARGVRRIEQFTLHVRFDTETCTADFRWQAELTGATGWARVDFYPAEERLRGLLSQRNGASRADVYPVTSAGVVNLLNGFLTEYPTMFGGISAELVSTVGGKSRGEDVTHELEKGKEGAWLRDEVLKMGEVALSNHRYEQEVKRGARWIDPKLRAKQAAAQVRQEEKAAAYRAEREARLKAQDAARARAEAEAKAKEKPVAGKGLATTGGATTARPAAPVPAVAVKLEMPSLAGVGLAEGVLRDLAGLRRREAGAQWWVSNQSDDLLCLPSCRVRRLEYQVRTALRALGPLQGRALLSDEVGLGKTIEAGLIAKELCTRGMVRRLLVLTLPSLVDQWEEELADKFDLVVTTTNHAAFASDPARVWAEAPMIVASLHTFKQAAQLAEAAKIGWDLVIVDEAHYLRRRESQAWQAVNALKRQYMLMLTATPVQNSLEELYNLVTLLKPGQLPSPKEFRARFLDPKQPRQPREPEELRRLLGQVMIRNTRANSGLELPPRRAETVLFTPEATELAWWVEWEAELRVALAALPASLASLWGRLLLRALGSSPAAWSAALRKFPDARATARWLAAAQARAGGATGWAQKIRLLAPLARMSGGVVIFTEFLETQAALATELRTSGAPVWVINGSTPAAERQPITEKFQREGGALLLTHSGTEGRNLQFCHTLANFDLPWNPMEIEQRIGRLHRLGQTQPVRICNFVQAGTLQEHLLAVLQEKLNLFELVVGETGLVLGERYSGDEFAEEVFSRWRDHEGRVGEAVAALGEELAAARSAYAEVKALDNTLFAKDYESL